MFQKVSDFLNKPLLSVLLQYPVNKQCYNHPYCCIKDSVYSITQIGMHWCTEQYNTEYDAAWLYTTWLECTAQLNQYNDANKQQHRKVHAMSTFWESKQIHTEQYHRKNTTNECSK